MTGSLCKGQTQLFNQSLTQDGSRPCHIPGSASGLQCPDVHMVLPAKRLNPANRFITPLCHRNLTSHAFTGLFGDGINEFPTSKNAFVALLGDPDMP